LARAGFSCSPRRERLRVAGASKPLVVMVREARGSGSICRQRSYGSLICSPATVQLQELQYVKLEGPVGFEPTTPGLKVARAPSQPLTPHPTVDSFVSEICSPISHGVYAHTTVSRHFCSQNAVKYYGPRKALTRRSGIAAALPSALASQPSHWGRLGSET